ncbi:MAG: hypothetical protein ACRYFS_22980 [Janthinobacterium lividum]
MGTTMDDWIEYDDEMRNQPERAADPPFSTPHDNCIPLDHFAQFHRAKDYRFFAALSGVHSRADDPAPLFPMRGNLPPNVSATAKNAVTEMAGTPNPILGWLTYPEIVLALAHASLSRDKLDLTTHLVLDLMQSIENRLGKGHSRLIFLIW